MTDTAERVDIDALKDKARLLRKLMIEMTTKAGSGHPSSSMSAAEVVAALYFGGILRHKPDDPKWADRDRFIMSKGHGCPAQYAALAEAGYFPHEWLDGLRQIGEPLEGHPNMHRVPGIEASTGSLGQGLSIGEGVAFAGWLDKKDYKVYVMTGDGEINEGQIWEAAFGAKKYQLPNLVWIVDRNGFQQTGATKDIMPLDPLENKIKAFGWTVRVINGQSMEEVMDALTEAKNHKDGPFCIISNTKKGAGVSFVEGDFSYHGKALTEDEKKRAMEELGYGDR
jgi:transketolase